MVSQKIMDCHENCDILLPNGMAYHHMEAWVVTNCKGQQYFQLINNEINSSNQLHESWCWQIRPHHLVGI
jgi:hypothetical protein